MAPYTLDLFVMDLIIMSIAYVYVFAAILIPVGLKKKDKISKFTARKMVHLFAGLVVLIVPFFNWPYFAVIIAGSLTAVTYFSQRDSNVKALKDLYDSISEEQEEGAGRLTGPFNYCLSITALITFFAIVDPTKFYFPISGILIMIIADTLASMVGKRIGKVKISLPWTNTTRSLEGSLVFFGAALLLCLFSYSLFGVIDPANQTPLSIEEVIIFSVITSLIGTVIEQLSPSTYDDLIVPIATTIIIWLLTTLF